MTPKDQNIREIPKSLQGIELVLRYLSTRKKKATSIRNISNNTDLSIRVVKNILLQLEKFNQIERVLEKNNVVPKWKITKFGRRVLKEANGRFTQQDIYIKHEDLLSNIIVPSSLEELNEKTKKKNELLISNLGYILAELSKLLGPVLNLGEPQLEDLFSFFIKRIKIIKENLSNLPPDPTAIYNLEKMGAKKRKISKKEIKSLLIEIFFFNSIIENELKRIPEFINELFNLIESKAISKANLTLKELRNEIRLLTNLVNQRLLLSIDSHVLKDEDLIQIQKNNISKDILDDIIKISTSNDIVGDGIKEIVLKYLSMIDKGQKIIKDQNYEISEFIPLYLLHQLILDEKTNIYFSLEQLEENLNELAESGYLPGIKIIKDDQNNEYKVLQLKASDINEDETNLVKIAIKLQKFTIADVISETGWNKEKCLKLLMKLTELGIMKYSKSFLHGESWYVISEQL